MSKALLLFVISLMIRQSTSNEFADDFKEVAAKTILGSAEQIETSYHNLMRRFKDIKTEASYEVRECLHKSENELKKIPGNLLKDIVDCVVKRIDDAVGIVNATLKRVNGKEKYIENCRGFCVKEILGLISSKTLNLPREIVKDVVSSAKAVANLNTSLKECASMEIGKFYKIIEEVGSVFNKCINTK